MSSLELYISYMAVSTVPTQQLLSNNLLPFIKDNLQYALNNSDIQAMRKKIGEKERHLSKQRANVNKDLRRYRDQVKEELRISRKQNIEQARNNIQLLVMRSNAVPTMNNSIFMDEIRDLKQGLEKLAVTLN